MNRQTTLCDDDDVIKIDTPQTQVNVTSSAVCSLPVTDIKPKVKEKGRQQITLNGGVSGIGSGQGNGRGSGSGAGYGSPPPPPRPMPTPVPKTISGGVVNSKATNLPTPVYPPAAQAIRASGAVNMQVTIDESGNVISAKAISGHPLLRAAAEQAARNAKFAPTMLSGQPVKTTGVIVYNFTMPNNSNPNVATSLGEMRVQSEEAKETSVITPEIKRRQMLAEKLHVWLYALVERLQKAETAQTPNEAKFVKDRKAEVQVWFSNKTSAAVEKLKALGFEVSEEKQNKIVVGKIAIEKIADLAEIAEVQYVLPQVK